MLIASILLFFMPSTVELYGCEYMYGTCIVQYEKHADRIAQMPTTRMLLQCTCTVVVRRLSIPESRTGERRALLAILMPYYQYMYKWLVYIWLVYKQRLVHVMTVVHCDTIVYIRVHTDFIQRPTSLTIHIRAGTGVWVGCGRAEIGRAHV